MSLLTVAPSFARPVTTNAPALLSVKVTITDHSIVLRPNHAARGSTVTFILTNRGSKTHSFVIGDVKRGPGHTQGFGRTLKPNQQLSIVMYLDVRGLMKYYNRTGSTPVATGSFRTT
jgi:hypothetical protein